MAQRGSKLLKILLATCSLLVLAALILALANASEATRRDRPYDAKTLSPVELVELREVFDLQRELGGQVFHGFDAAVVPLVFYNDRYEFLSGYLVPKANGKAAQAWEKVETVDGQYYRRLAQEPESFARKINGQWVGSIVALDPANRDMLINAREQLPEPIASLFPYSWLTTEPDLHVVLSLHEMFHAYQAQRNEARFLIARDLYTEERNYPFRSDGFEASWNREGELLHAGMQAQDQTDRQRCIEEFLEHRLQRRSRFELSAKQIAFECELEWLEGLAKYVEMRLHELAAGKGRRFGAQDYPLDPPNHWDDLRRLGSSLGSQDGDLRFYLSGMAQARLLERQLPGWQERALGDARLEDLLAESIGR